LLGDSRMKRTWRRITFDVYISVGPPRLLHYPFDPAKVNI
jgi:hypothetical protein